MIFINTVNHITLSNKENSWPKTIWKLMIFFLFDEANLRTFFRFLIFSDLQILFLWQHYFAYCIKTLFNPMLNSWNFFYGLWSSVAALHKHSSKLLSLKDMLPKPFLSFIFSFQLCPHLPDSTGWSPPLTSLLSLWFAEKEQVESTVAAI